ncbi:hypothetical protein [Pseudooceanicola sp.]|uniref:hypothetical protein n=1 Tax=Pseudooceanicola sp. TaxID=1914328 RepID=UPI0035C69008
MRPVFLIACLLPLPLPLIAEPLTRTDPPAPIVDQLRAEAGANGELFDGVSGWPVDLEGDGTMEWLVQAAYPFKGGNAVYVRTYLFDGEDTGYGASADIGLDRSLKRVEQVDGNLHLVIFELLDNDPRCCPSGESTRILTIGN